MKYKNSNTAQDQSRLKLFQLALVLSCPYMSKKTYNSLGRLYLHRIQSIVVRFMTRVMNTLTSIRAASGDSCFPSSQTTKSDTSSTTPASQNKVEMEAVKVNHVGSTTNIKQHRKMQTFI